MYYKSDWDKAKKRIEAFWNNEIIDRCCINVLSPRKTSKMPPFPELQMGPFLRGLEDFSEDDEESIKKWWTDPEEIYKRMIFWFENTYFGGEAIPAQDLNWGAMSMAAFYGSEPKFTKKTVWYPKVIEDWKSWDWISNPKENKYWTKLKDIVELLVNRCDERYFVGIPQVGTAGDLLSLMRGMDTLSLDLFDNAEEVKKAIDIMGDTWVEFHEEFYQMTKDVNNGAGVIAWMSLWAPGRHTYLACDFSTVLSPEMFKKFFIPEIEKEGNWCEFGSYHLDGPEALYAHLDELLEIDQIDNIEWTPGIGNPPTLTQKYIPEYKKIQKKGKKLFLLAKPQEIEPLLRELSPKGLFIHTQVASEEEANKLIKDVKKWSAGKNVF